MPFNPSDRRMNSGRQSVYIAEMASEPPVYKIGVSHDPERRIENFRWGPWPVKVLYVIESADSGAIEDWLHFRFRAGHLKCEWFRLSAEDLAELAAVKKADAPSDLPAYFTPTDFSPWSQRNRKHRKPRTYKFKYKHKDPGHSAIEMTSEQAVAIGIRCREARMTRRIELEDMTCFTAKTSEEYDYRSAFRDECKGFKAIEDASTMVTPFRLAVYAVNMGLSVTELLGEELIHLVPDEYRGKIALPPSYPPDWVPDLRARREQARIEYWAERRAKEAEKASDAVV